MYTFLAKRNACNFLKELLICDKGLPLLYELKNLNNVFFKRLLIVIRYIYLNLYSFFYSGNYKQSRNSKNHQLSNIKIKIR